jgi:VWFA-related protein
MNVIADSTGGRAFYNTNGLREAMDAAVRQGSEYYTLTYAPSNTKADGSERKIKVVLKDPGYQLSYRRSYLADDARHPAPVHPLAAGYEHAARRAQLLGVVL